MILCVAEVFLLGFPNTTRVEETGLGDLVQSLPVLWVFLRTSR